MSQQKPAAWATIKNGIPNAWMWNPEFVEENKDAKVVLYSAPVEREQEPVAVVEITYGREPECYVTGNIDDFPEGVFKLYAAPVQHAEQEPVGVVEGSGEWGIAGVLVAGVPIGTKLYAAPVRTKDLTDDEIADIVYEMNGNEPTAPFWRDLARAVIATDREKNRG